MSERSHLRLVVLQVLVLALMVTLLGRLWYLQVVTGEQYKVAATDNRVREVVTPAVRGLILDDQGRLQAEPGDVASDEFEPRRPDVCGDRAAGVADQAG